MNGISETCHPATHPVLDFLPLGYVAVMSLLAKCRFQGSDVDLTARLCCSLLLPLPFDL